MKRNGSLVTNILFAIGFVATILGGLIFVLFSDTKLKIASSWLFGSVITGIGGVIFYLLSEYNKEDNPKAAKFYKITGFVLLIGYVIFLVSYYSSAAFPQTQKLKPVATNITFTCLGLVAFGIVIWIIHSVFEARDIQKYEEEKNRYRNPRTILIQR